MQEFTKIRHILFAFLLGITPVATFGQVVSIGVVPPVLPVYEQPPCPGDGYLWTPGYWAYGDEGYYWVPGVWVEPPRVGVLWTPGYWGFTGGVYAWHPGYWGPHVGFYGGINYGFGYQGIGFVGGAWQGNAFRYNTAVTNVNTSIVHNTYVDRTVINNSTTVNNRASFNGTGGVTAQPTTKEQAALHEQHVQSTSVQLSHEEAARHDRNQLASVNNGHPTTTALSSAKGAQHQDNKNTSGQPNGHETSTLAKHESKSKQGVHADEHANEEKVKGQEHQLKGEQHQKRPPSEGRQEAKPGEKKASPKPHSQSKHNEKAEPQKKE
jgi:hypothetical protein